MSAQRATLTAPAVSGPRVNVVRRRMVALLVDLAIMWFLLHVLVPLFLPLQLVISQPSSPGESPSLLVGSLSVDGWLWTIAATFIYFSLFEALFATTPGKSAFGLRVADRWGGRPSLDRVLLRNLVRPIEALPPDFLIGAVAVSASPLRQRIGDRLAGTIVALDPSVPGVALPQPISRHRVLLCSGAILAVFLLGWLVSYVNPWPPATSIHTGSLNSSTSTIGIDVGGPAQQARVVRISARTSSWRPGITTYSVDSDVVRRVAPHHYRCVDQIQMNWRPNPLPVWLLQSFSGECRPR